MKNILVAGGGGYIGTVLCEELLNLGYDVLCLDRFFFGEDDRTRPQKKITMIRDDTRFVHPGIFDGIDAVIDLAGIPNDPACDLDPVFTEDVNHKGSLRIAQLARQAGVKRFLYSSSCSVYGIGENRSLAEDAALNPVSCYAKTKIQTEIDLCKMAGRDFCVTILRNATVYGVSPRMRFDLLVNLMTAHAVTRGKIYVLGGGEQWRPLVHVRDVCMAIIESMAAPISKVNGEVFNVGSNDQNYQVIQVAKKICEIMPYAGIDVVPDDIEIRNYRINFDKIRKRLGFKVRYDLIDGITEVKQAIENGEIDISDVRTSRTNYYKYLFKSGQISSENIKILPVE